jgi:dihydroorotate dehydrogenase electron transfer subunit
MKSNGERRLRQEVTTVQSNRLVAHKTWLLTFRSPAIASTVAPGQFVNIRVDEGYLPLLRRPFSISRVHGEELDILFAVVGPGTKILAAKKPGDPLDVLGPLGKPFCTDSDFGAAVIVAGGVGTAPFPFLTDALRKLKKPVLSFVGARSAEYLTLDGFENVQTATDDGTQGFRGTVVQLLDSYLGGNPVPRPKIFGCGPTAMLKALQQAAAARRIPCELSLEGEMACGVGICQGCPVRRTDGPTKYALVCTDGPAFDATEIVLE